MGSHLPTGFFGDYFRNYRNFSSVLADSSDLRVFLDPGAGHPGMPEVAEWHVRGAIYPYLTGICPWSQRSCFRSVLGSFSEVPSEGLPPGLKALSLRKGSQKRAEKGAHYAPSHDPGWPAWEACFSLLSQPRF